MAHHVRTGDIYVINGITWKVLWTSGRDAKVQNTNLPLDQRTMAKASLKAKDLLERGF